MKKIEVITLPNGYQLSLDDKEYMYFNVFGLLMGIFVHAVEEEAKAVDGEDCRHWEEWPMKRRLISPWDGVCGEVYHTAASGASAAGPVRLRRRDA